MPITYKIALCDDQPEHLRDMREKTETILRDQQIRFRASAFLSAAQLLAAVRHNPNAFDIILLDVLLDGTDGVQAARALRENGCSAKIIFITVTAEFATRGYEVNAHRYLLKPVQPGELEAALLSCMQERAGEKIVAFKSSGRIRHVKANKITYIETHERGVCVHLEKESFASPARITELEEALPPGIFIRCHRSYMVNLMYVGRIGRYEALLSNGDRVPLGRKYYDGAKRKFLAFLAE